MAKKEKSAGVYQGHCACPSCGSSDAGAFYLHDDETYSFTCFSANCSHTSQNFDADNLQEVVYKREVDPEETARQMDHIKDELIAVRNKDRKLPDTVYDLYGCRMEVQSDGATIETIYYPTFRPAINGELSHVGYRNRRRYKPWHKQVKKKPELLGVLKCFDGGVGDIKKGICLFGQWLFNDSKKNRVIVCCGEEDAMTAYHMTSLNTKFDGGYPCVSVPSGENVDGVKPHLRWLSSFKEIIIVADQDKAGRKFEEEFARLLPVGKVRLARLPKGIKDPSDMWKNAGNAVRREAAAKRFYNLIFDAEKYSPAGVMSLSEGWSSYTQRGKDTLLRFPDSFGDLNALTHGGYALGEIINIIAPSSVGKSSFVKEMIYETVMNTPYNVGVLSLEETIDEFIEGILSIAMSTQLNEISHDKRDYDQEYEHFQKLIHHYPANYKMEEEDKMERIHFLDHQGACEGDELLQKIDFLVNGLDCKMIILDPVTLACSGDTDEDDMASEIVKRTKRHKLAWVNVHHVRKNSNGGKANSEGADLAEEDIKGCLSADSEYLSPEGWRRMDEYNGGLVAEYCPVSKTTKFVKPVNYVAVPCNQGFHHLKTAKGIDAMVSDEHTMYYQKQRSNKLHTIKAKDMVKKHKKLSQGFRGRFETVSQGHEFGSGVSLNENELKLAVAFQADGTLRNLANGEVEFNLKKGRKKVQLRGILDNMGIDYSENPNTNSKGYSTFTFIMPIELCFKKFPSSWWDVTEAQARLVLDECFLWDGHNGSYRAYFSNYKENCDYIQYLSTILGIRSVVDKEAPPKSNSESTSNCYWCRLSENASTTVSMAHIAGALPVEKVASEDGMKYCFVTSTGAFVSRRNGRVMMTGNTGAWFQTGMINLIFTRNKVHKDPIVRNTTRIKMSKCRRHGKNTGIAGYIRYNGDNGRLELGQDIEEYLSSQTEFDDEGDRPLNSFSDEF